MVTTEDIKKLQDENTILRKLADVDPLTGILNRRSSEMKIKEAMALGGTLFVCDLDFFKSINDTYGHLIGDRCLQRTAELLTYITRSKDIVGRIGGDEFVVFACGATTPEVVEIIRNKIETRFESYNRQADIKLSISIGAAIYEPGDTYKRLFGRADDDLFEQKKIHHEKHDEQGEAEENWIRDMTQIREDLVEQINKKSGAFCQSYDAFKVIFRFLERTMRRNDQQACLVLISAVKKGGKTANAEGRSEMMDQLGELIRKNLRLGDVYTRYSNCQFLILLNDVTLDLAEMIALRIRKKYLESVGDMPTDDVLLHYCYQLEAAKVLLEEE